MKTEVQRRISWLIAAKSVDRPFIGTASTLAGAVSVGRAMDKVHPAEGRIYLPDPVNDPTLIRGIDTKFDTEEYEIGGLIVLPTVNGKTASSNILEILGPEELRLKNPLKGADAIKQLTGRDDIDSEGRLIDQSAVTGPREGFEGSKFKVAPYVDQTQVYDEVFKRLNEGGCIGIFPEGGSHDRTDLLPLKGNGDLSFNARCILTLCQPVLLSWRLERWQPIQIAMCKSFLAE